ncbi:signal peptide peptidase-domain-containing protein [Phaeosphaeriaceae sp. PMI808]|nr:signal peptide peptidase-domain-containing protein [Phaeosphaeriaceae sp. PMI808]
MAEPDPSFIAQVLGRAAYEFSKAQPMLPMYAHLIVSALFPIYTGAHASLSRPSSAAKPCRKKRITKDKRADGDDEDEDEEGEEEDDEEDEDDEDEERIMEGLSPTDALLMPLFAGGALASLYFLLKWMKDPALLNKILNAYFAIFGVFSVARLVTHMLDIGHSLIFPHRHVLHGTLYHVNAKEEKAVPVPGSHKDKQPLVSPLPGFLARIPLSHGARKMLWADRAMPGNKWTLRLYLHRITAGRTKVSPHGIVGLLVGLTTVAYFNLVDKPWYLTNLLGFGFSYGALQLMSPTTFATGSLILCALFFYDIYFVFYTPMMVTVAKSLDVPIKLMFPRPAPADDPSAPLLMPCSASKLIPALTQAEADTVEKPQYHSLAGRWSDHFWTHSLIGRPLWVTVAKESKAEAPFTFPKIYFKASLVGYILGLLATLGVMMVWNHAQPALLYLVPGVLGSIWLTALVRGELSLVWNYTEEIEEEEKKEKKNNPTDDTKEPCKEKTSSSTEGKEPEVPKHATSHRPKREVFSFSIEAPRKLKQQRSIPKESRSQQNATSTSQDESEKHNWAPTKATPNKEPTGKRVRLN